jgi:Na+/H+-dicarboxylate symporter
MAYLISFQTTEYCGRVSAVQAVVADVLEPCFSFSLPRIVSNDVVLVLGALSSLVLFFTVNRAAMAVSGILERFTRVYFRILVPMMPIFIIGTALKLQSEGVLSQMFKQYLPILLVFMLSACIWIFLQFLTACNFKFQRLSSCLGSIVPAVTTAFSTASSASALPLSIKAAEKNTSNNSAGIIVPSSVNIHLVGDCFFIPMIAIAIMNSFGQELPGIVIYSLFAVHFVLAKFAVAAIPGGGIIVMLPILQDYLGFAADMQAVAMALYMLFDPLITACNVGGNCALAIFFDKIVGLFEKPSGKPGGKPNATSGKNYRKSGKNNEGR